MEHWSLPSLELESHAPRILRTDEGASRVLALRLGPGEELAEHETHEHAWLVLAEGELEIDEGSLSERVLPGSVVHFSPGERRTLRARADCLLVLLLAPWPGKGHPGALDTAAASEA